MKVQGSHSSTGKTVDWQTDSCKKTPNHVVATYIYLNTQLAVVCIMLLLLKWHHFGRGLRLWLLSLLLSVVYCARPSLAWELRSALLRLALALAGFALDWYTAVCVLAEAHAPFTLHADSKRTRCKPILQHYTFQTRELLQLVSCRLVLLLAAHFGLVHFSAAAPWRVQGKG